MKNERKIICVVGPTASGKTKLAVELAKKFGGEIISADSRQVFRGLTIGTGKDLQEYDNIAYHLIDIKNSGEEFTLFDFLDLARVKIEEIFSKDKLPIIVGGTGLYVQALVEGFEISQKSKVKSKNCNLEVNKYSREELEKMAKGELQEILIDIDEEAFLTIDLANPYRMIRAIEKAQGGEEIAKVKPNFEVLQIGVDVPREILFNKIDSRADAWFLEGFYEEVEGLLNDGVSLEWLNKIGLEYKILANYIESQKAKGKINLPVEASLKAMQAGNCNLEVIKDTEEFDLMKQEMKFKIHQYARRQLTWFRRFSEIVWIQDIQGAESIAQKYLDEV